MEVSQGLMGSVGFAPTHISDSLVHGAAPTHVSATLIEQCSEVYSACRDREWQRCSLCSTKGRCAGFAAVIRADELSCLVGKPPSLSEHPRLFNLVAATAWRHLPPLPSPAGSTEST